MSCTIKVDGFDLGTGSAPLLARNAQFSGSMPGGHGAASFEVWVDNAYLAPHHKLRIGNWVELRDPHGGELYEGQIFTIKPVVSLGGQDKFIVTCGGLISVAAMREDVYKTWTHRGSEGWRISPNGNKSGEYSLDKDGLIELRVRRGTTEYFNEPMAAEWWLDGGLSDEVISGIDYTVAWDVTTEASGRYWSWYLYDGVMEFQEGGTSNAGTSGSLTPPATASTLAIALYSTGTEAATSADKYVTFTKLDVHSSSKTGKVRVDEVMVDLATRPGLATSSVSENIGKVLDDMRLAGADAASGLKTAAALYGQPLDYGFWDNRVFHIRQIERRPANDSHVIVVGGPNPGLTSWEVDEENDDELPDYVCILFGNKDDQNMAEGQVRRIYAPTTPPDRADLVVKTVDFSGLILSDSAAAAIGANLIRASAYDIPDGAVFDAHPEYAKNSTAAGNNIDPTSSYAQTLPEGTAGTLTGFAYTSASGWDGSNVMDDPTCLVLDGTDYVTWGDYSILDFASGAFTIGAWFRLAVLDVAQTICGKRAATPTFQGWSLTVSPTNHLVALVSETVATSKRKLTVHTTQLTSGVWYHACMVYDAVTASPLVLYLNGVSNPLYAVGAGTAVGSTSNTASMKLGAV